jgi:hypothetical protein
VNILGNGKIRKRKSKFTQVSNNVLMDESLTLKAIGLYSKINYYLNIPDWDLYKPFLMGKCKEGRDSFNSAWEELKKKGYLIQHKIQDKSSKGKYYYEYELLDELPRYGFSVAGKSVHGESTHGKAVPINNNDYNKTLNNKTLNNNNSKKAKKKVVVVSQNAQNIADKFKELYNADLNLKRTQEMIDTKGIEIVTLYLNEYSDYIQGREIERLGADFYKCVMDGYTKPKSINNKNVPKYADFKQRQYSEEDYEQFYANLQD